MAVEVSVVLPAYDEAETLADTVETTLETLAAFLPDGSYEVIVAEDGCTDDTPAVAERLAATHDGVRHVHSDDRLGRGRALERAFRAAGGDTLVYFDTDLATDMRYLEPLVESVRSGEHDLATGSRWMPGDEADRPTQRAVPSRAYNALVRGVLRSRLRDHQCGFKAFDREALFDLLPADDDHWFWDTEVLVRAQRAGYRIREFPVEWTPKGDSSVDLVRDVFGMGGGIARTFWRLDVRPRIGRRASIAAGAALAVAALGLMLLYLDPATVVDRLRSADVRLVVAAAGLYLVSWPVRGRRYRDILSALGVHEGTGFLTGAIFVSQTGNLVFPARAGDAVRAYVMKARRGIGYPTGFASLAAERAYDLLTLVGFAGLTAVLIAATGGDVATTVASTGGVSARSVRIALAVAAGVGVVSIVATVALLAATRSDATRVRAAVTRLSTDAYADRLARHVERFVGDLGRVARDGSQPAVVGGSVVIWALDVATAAVVVLAFPDVSLASTTLVGVAFLAVSVGNLAKVLPLSPGGVGLYEAAFTGIVAGLTPVAGATAFSAAVLDHAVKNVVTVAGGGVSMLALNVSLTTAVDRGADAYEDAEADGAD